GRRSPHCTSAYVSQVPGVVPVGGGHAISPLERSMSSMRVYRMGLNGSALSVPSSPPLAVGAPEHAVHAIPTRVKPTRRRQPACRVLFGCVLVRITDSLRTT